MKKRIRMIILMAVILFLLTGCMTTTDINGDEQPVEYGLVRVHTISGSGNRASYVAYDPETLVCYILVSGTYRYSISPYYIMGKNGEPEIAVYGRNYPGN